MEHKFLAFILHENDVFTWKVHEKNIELGQVLKKSTNSQILENSEENM